jgi:hypothetical protein
MKKTGKFLIQVKEIPNSEIGELDLDVYSNLPPKCIIGKAYEIIILEGRTFPRIVDESGEVNLNVFEGCLGDVIIDSHCVASNDLYIDYTEYFRVVEGVEALGYILSYSGEDEDENDS